MPKLRHELWRKEVCRLESNGLTGGLRPTRTEQRASLTIFCETLPRKNRPRADRPCEPTTIKFASSSFALVITSCQGDPVRTSILTFHAEEIDDKCVIASFATERILSTSWAAISCADLTSGGV